MVDLSEGIFGDMVLWFEIFYTRWADRFFYKIDNLS